MDRAVFALLCIAVVGCSDGSSGDPPPADELKYTLVFRFEEPGLVDLDILNRLEGCTWVRVWFRDSRDTGWYYLETNPVDNTQGISVGWTCPGIYDVQWECEDGETGGRMNQDVGAFPNAQYIIVR